MDCSRPGFSVFYYLPEFAQTHVHWVSDAIQPSCPLFPLLLPSVFPSMRVFSNQSAPCIRWPKYWSIDFSISPSKEYSGFISSRIYWFDLLAVQGTLKSYLQHHSLKESILWCLHFFMVQLSHPNMTAGKTIDLTRWTFVGKVMSLLYNELSRFFIDFLPRSKRLLFHGCNHHLQWFWTLRKCHEEMGLDAMIFSSIPLLSHVQLFATPWLQHARLPCPSPTPRAYSKSCPSS